MKQCSLLQPCGKDIEAWENFTYLGSIVHGSSSFGQEIIRQIGLAFAVIDLFTMIIWC